MSQLEGLKGDLHFVRAAVERADRDGSPTVIYMLWAILVLCGFVLMDVRHTWVALYWSVAGPAGFLASAYLGGRQARRLGQVTAAVGWRHLLHWCGMLTAIFLAVLMPFSGTLQWKNLGPPILLILAVGYFHAGVHLDPALRWIGLLMGAGYLFVLYVSSSHAWTVVGLVLAAGLAVAGLRGGRPHAAAQ